MQSYERKVERHLTAIASAESTPDLQGGCQSKQAEAVAFVKRLAVATTTSYPGLERRREPRILTNHAASMQVLNPHSGWETRCPGTGRFEERTKTKHGHSTAARESRSGRPTDAGRLAVVSPSRLRVRYARYGG